MCPLPVALILCFAAPASMDADEPALWAWADEDAPENDAQPLEGRVLPNLVHPRVATVALRVEGFEGAPRTPYATDVVLEVPTDFVHEFDGTISNVHASVALFPPAALERVWRRLTLPPLTLDPTELDAELDAPSVTRFFALTDDADVPTGSTSSRELAVEDITIDPRALPDYLLMVDHYELHDASARDVIAIFERGGAADNAALTQWARQYESEAAPLGPSERRQVMDALQARLRDMRAPPRLGDFQRLQALMACIRIVGGPEDLEALLALERPIKILHTSAVVSYEAALREEAALGLNVHGMGQLPSRSDYLGAPDVALRSLRPVGLARLLRLAYDPIDFRQAPPSAGFSRSSLQPLAADLLAPLNPTSVAGAFDLAGGRIDVEREIFRFYAQARHEPLAEPLLAWLIDHPQEVADVGVLAAHELPDAMLPGILQHYIEPEEPSVRAAMRELLLAMPVPSIPRIVEVLATAELGGSARRLTPTSNLTVALEQFERHEHEFAGERALELVEQLQEVGDDPGALRHALRDAARLAQLSPDLVETNAAKLIAVHAKAAREFHDSSPLDRGRALSQLADLPWGSHARDALDAREVALARGDVIDGDGDAALERLLAHDPELAGHATRAIFTKIIRERLENELERGEYSRAHVTLDIARDHVAEDLKIEEYSRRLFWVQYRPAIFLAVAFGLAIVSTLAWLVVRSGALGISRMRERRREYRRLMRRVEDAEANRVDTTSFSGSDFEMESGALDVDADTGAAANASAKPDAHAVEEAADAPSPQPRARSDYDSFTADWSTDAPSRRDAS